MEERSADPYIMVPAEAGNHQLSPSFNMLAIFFILQVNYPLTCSFISPFKEMKGILEKCAKVNFLKCLLACSGPGPAGGGHLQPGEDVHRGHGGGDGGLL